MSKLTVIIKNRPGYQEGMYGISIGHDSGGAANVEPIKDEAALRARLLGFGLNKEHTEDLIGRLKNKHESVRFDIQPKERGDPECAHCGHFESKHKNGQCYGGENVGDQVKSVYACPCTEFIKS